MKYHWEPKDVVCGRIVCKPNPKEEKFEPTGWTAKWTFKIGFLAGGNPPDKPQDFSSKQRAKETRCDYCLVAMTDGMISEAKTQQEIADWLNKEEMIPMSQEWFLATITYLHHLNENGNTW